MPYNKVVTGWGVMGLSAYGSIANIGTNPAPYQSTHTLITTADPTTTLVDKYHNGTAIDTYIPKDANGKYIYDLVWEYLIDGGVATPPPSNNLAPIARAGADLSLAASTNPTPTLNATTSKDPDGYIVSFAWSKVSGPASFTIVTPAGGQTKLTNLEAGTYVFRVTVTDNKGAVGTDDVQVTITGSVVPPSGNQAPVTLAGPDLSLPLSSNPSPTLNGNPSKDPDGYIVSFAWSKISGTSSFTIATPNTGKTKISNLVLGTYVFQLTATDNKGAAGTDEVSVTVY